MTPDLTTEVIGFRQWYVTEGLGLRSAHKNSVVWERGTNTAKCHREDGFQWQLTNAQGTRIAGSETQAPCVEPPGHDCECGLYALHSPDDFWYGKEGNSLTIDRSHGDTLVSGVVVAWSAMEVHHHGFRAQHARIVALATPTGKRDAVVARAAAAEYGVPLVVAEELPRIAAEFGQTVPEAMRPPKSARQELGTTIQGYANYIWGIAHSPYCGGVYSHHFHAQTQSPPQSLHNGGYLPSHRDTIVKDVLANTPKRRSAYDPSKFLPKRKGGKA